MGNTTTVGKSFGVEPLEATFGAVVTGLRLAQLDDDSFARLYDTWLEYALLVFPAQHLTNEEQVAFAKRFGDLEFDLAPLSNVREDGTVRVEDDDDDVLKVLKGNMRWHCDSTYMPVQAKGAVFTAHVVPSSGGETGWADMRAGYDALDDEMRARISDLSAYHSLYYSQAKLGHVPKEGSDYTGYGFPRPGPAAAAAREDPPGDRTTLAGDRSPRVRHSRDGPGRIRAAAAGPGRLGLPGAADLPPHLVPG